MVCCKYLPRAEVHLGPWMSLVIVRYCESSSFASTIKQHVNKMPTKCQRMLKLWTAHAFQAAISACAKASEWVRNLEFQGPPRCFQSVLHSLTWLQELAFFTGQYWTNLFEPNIYTLPLNCFYYDICHSDAQTVTEAEETALALMNEESRQVKGENIRRRQRSPIFGSIPDSFAMFGKDSNLII